MANIEDFGKLDIRVGEIISVEDFPEAKIPAFKLKINFGETIGIKASSARVVKYYTKEQLLGMKVLGIINLPPRQIGPFTSEVLTLGVPDREGECVLIIPENRNAVIGGKLF